MNVIFGGGGFAREVGWLFDEVSRFSSRRDRIDAYVVNDSAPNIGETLDGARVTAESEFFLSRKDEVLNVFLAVGSPSLRRRLHEKCFALKSVEFPALIHPRVLMDQRQNAVRVGSGVIICAGAVLTTDIDIGAFAHLNLNCTVGHGAKIGAFTTLSPGVHVSGNVHLSSDTFVGTGAVILENIHVRQGAIVGAGATVVKSITEPGTYIGTPARLQQ